MVAAVKICSGTTIAAGSFPSLTTSTAMTTMPVPLSETVIGLYRGHAAHGTRTAAAAASCVENYECHVSASTQDAACGLVD